MQRRKFSRGFKLEAVTARLECGDERYAWLNESIVVGTGTQTASGPVNDFCTIGD
jgi:hypothetical protein